MLRGRGIDAAALAGGFTAVLGLGGKGGEAGVGGAAEGRVDA